MNEKHSRKYSIEIDYSKVNNLDYMLCKCNEAMEKGGVKKFYNKEELRELGFGKLAWAIQKSDILSYPKIREIFGETKSKKYSIEIDFKKVDNLDYILCKCNEAMEIGKVKKFYNGEELKNLGFQKLYTAIAKSKIVSMRKIREEFGEIEPKKYSIEIDFNKINNLNYMVSKCNEAIKIGGVKQFYASKELNELGFGKLATAIFKSDVISFPKIKEIFAEMEPKKNTIEIDFNKINNLNYMLDKCKEAMEIRGVKKFYTSKELNKLGFGKLAKAIFKSDVISFPKIKEIFAEMGPKIYSIEIDYNKANNLNYMLDKCKEAMEIRGVKKFYTSKELRVFGFGNLYNTIRKSEILSIPKIKKIFAEMEPKIYSIEIDYSKVNDLDYMLCKCNEAMEIGGVQKFYTIKELRELGFANLYNAVAKSKILSMPKIKKIFGETEPQKYSIEIDFKKVNNLDYMLCKCNEAMEKGGVKKFYNKEELRELGFGKLATAIFKSDILSYPKIREMFGETKSKKYSFEIDFKKVNNLNYMLCKCNEAMEIGGVKKFYNGEELKNLGFQKLYTAIAKSKIISMRKIRQEFGEIDTKKYSIEVNYTKVNDLNYMLNKCKEAMKLGSVEKFYTLEELKQLGFGRLATAINKSEILSIKKIKKEFGETLIEIDSKKKDNLNYIVSLTKEIMNREKYELLPTVEKIIFDGYGNYVNFVKRSRFNFTNIIEKLEGKTVLNEKESLEAFMLEYINRD